MKQIQKISLERLANGAHFLFLTNAHKRATTYAGVKDKVVNELHALEMALKEEDRILATSQKSPLSDEIKNADRQRDKIYRGIEKALNAFMLFPNEETVNAAKEVKRIMKAHNIKTGMQLDRETGMLLNLIGDFENKCQAEIAKLGLTTTVVELKTVNNKLIGVTEDRLKGSIAVIVGDLKRARNQSDEAYRALVLKINALAVVEGDAPYAPFIDLMNAEIKHYKEDAVIHKKKKDNEKPGDDKKKPGDDKKPSDPKKPDDPKKPSDPKKPGDGKTPKPGREEDPGEDQV